MSYFSSFWRVLLDFGCIRKWFQQSLLWFLIDRQQQGNCFSTSPSEENCWQLWRTHKDWLQTIVYVGVFYLAFTILFAEGYQIPSGSMEPTFHGDPHILKGDRIFAWKGISMLDEFKRGDIIIFISVEDEKTFMVKRLVGLPGDIVQIKNGQIYVNGNVLDCVDIFKTNTYYVPKFYKVGDELQFSMSSKIPPITHVKTIYSMLPTGKFLQCFGQQPMLVPKDCFFVLGDNSEHSNDSRYWGCVPKRNVLGKAALIWWPPYRSRLIP
ncbi:MAG TPA: signal peptidase I [Planctomycetota bacterium]|nr:signal peptidase I [Planctomycetota bacterium]